MSPTDIPGYTYGTAAVARSPVSLQDLELLKATLLLGDDDLAALRRSGEVLGQGRGRPRGGRRHARRLGQGGPASGGPLESTLRP